MKTVAIMQPYFFPYIGYWQLISLADVFVVYDDIEYTKKGWINRNRILEQGHDRLFTIPLKKDSDYLAVNQRQLSDTATEENNRTLRIIANNYRKAPQFATVYPLIEKCFQFEDKNLFNYIFNSIKTISQYLGIPERFVVSSQLNVAHQSLKGQDKVLAICKDLEATTYVNSIGGTELYDKDVFKAQAIDLKFLQTGSITYPQFDHEFVPSLSIIDVMMFNEIDQVKEKLKNFQLI